MMSNFDPIAHAKAYPFPAPDFSYLYQNGTWCPLEGRDINTSLRVPVLAAGSNQSPEQLARKYRNLPGIGLIPAERGLLKDFDVVYAAHFARYGSVPATFQRSSGTTVRVFVLWLTERQLKRMHETEGNYSYDCLTDLELELDGGRSLVDAFAYTSQFGCFRHKGSCVSLAEIAAHHRKFPALCQSEILTVVRDFLSPGANFDEFIAEHINDHEVLVDRSKRLREKSIPIAYKRQVKTIL